MIIKLIIIVSFLYCYVIGKAQNQERAVFFYNVGMGTLQGGIGAIINKPKNVNWRKAFIKGAWQGSVGGLLHYAGKKTLYLSNKQQTNLYFWPSKIIHSCGTSLIENAALGNPFLKNWTIDYGPVRVDFSIAKKTIIKTRFLPMSIFATLLASKYGKFDLKNTLTTGHIVFKNKDLIRYANGNTQIGYSYGRAFVFVENPIYVPNSFQLKAHEIMHQFQYADMQIFNTWFKPVGTKIKSKKIKKLFNNYIYTDIPYSFLTYTLAGQYANPHYFRNFFEFEAQRFSTNQFVFR